MVDENEEGYMNMEDSEARDTTEAEGAQQDAPPQKASKETGHSVADEATGAGPPGEGAGAGGAGGAGGGDASTGGTGGSTGDAGGASTGGGSTGTGGGASSGGGSGN